MTLKGWRLKHFVFLLNSPLVEILAVYPSRRVLLNDLFVPKFRSGSRSHEACIPPMRPGLHWSDISGAFLENEFRDGIYK